MSIKKEIAMNIVATRKGLNLSQEQLALKAKIDRSHFAKVEKGEINFKIETLASIAEALKVDVKSLI